MAWVHGASGYKNHRCRCDICKAANTAMQRDYQRRRAARTAAAAAIKVLPASRAASWRDCNGNERVLNQWGFNSFRTAEGAENDARCYLNPGASWYIWHLADGTFDWSAITDPPEIPAELVTPLL